MNYIYIYNNYLKINWSEHYENIIVFRYCVLHGNQRQQFENQYGIIIIAVKCMTSSSNLHVS